MKLLLVAVLIALVLGFFAIRSFHSRFSGEIFLPPTSAPPTSTIETGGARRKTADIPAAPSSSAANPSGFHGPSGPPHINGPSAPPPGS